jgi:hypothetical protein
MRIPTRTWVLAASALTFLAPATAAVAGNPVPIEGDVSIIDYKVLSNNPPYLTQIRQITGGNVSYLGSCTGWALDTLDLTHAPFLLSFVDYFILEGAHGDSIIGVAMGSLTFNGHGYDVTETVTITGGTGRFAGATGSATGTGSVILAPGSPTEESFEGTITTPRPLK